MKYFCLAKVRAPARAVPGAVARPTRPEAALEYGIARSHETFHHNFRVVGRADGENGQTKGENKMKLRGKTLATLLTVLFLVCFVAVPIYAKESISIDMDQVQIQCRRWDPAGWRYWYHDYPITWDFERSGNVLQTEISYQPPVQDKVGASRVFVYDKKEELWIMHEGTVQYTSPYSGLTITEYWKGYLEFNGEPSQDNFVHGVGYQWGYVFGYDENTPPPHYTFAVWDDTMGAWDLGFSIYIWDFTSFDQSVYFDGDPEEPILTWEEVNGLEPVPKSDYNPLLE